MFRIRTLSQSFRPIHRPCAAPSQPLYRHAPIRTYKQRRVGGGRQGQHRYQRFDSAASGIFDFFSRWAAKPTFYRDVGFIIAGAGGVYVYNLEHVPVSGRQRFNIISPAMEEMMSKKTIDQVKKEYAGHFLPDDDKRVQMVRGILSRLLPFAKGEGLAGMDWEVHVIDSPEENAFVAPGGKVFVFTGILPLCKDEDGIAALLGHEIAHVVAHHTAERMSKAPLILLCSAVLSLFDVSFQMSSAALNILLSMPASRKHELEADYIGLMMMARGCYKPEAAMELWNRMEETDPEQPPQILSTHPSHKNRGAKIREWLPKAMEEAEQSECFVTSQFADGFSSALGGFDRW
ncbi:mitochondrial metalloendopeptidase OMA1 [Ampelomyces quisqualis]|uniref:Mitochondrial metalloendopeptidase OMA1 n=1 Tax=Ampelomyces quisqualis TaxID=50730 RepID=A0A6A5QRU5_AMPQU|nr:mitochondrial metalloendopeptidase OMA1 [Ampelomyces quisqualis]